MPKPGTKYLGNPQISPRATRSRQDTARLGGHQPKGYDVARQPSGVQDTSLWVADAQRDRMRRDQPDPLTGKTSETGPAHLRGRLNQRPTPRYGYGPEGANAGEG